MLNCHFFLFREDISFCTIEHEYVWKKVYSLRRKKEPEKQNILLNAQTHARSINHYKIFSGVRSGDRAGDYVFLK